MKKKNRKIGESKAITLIALVITVIIMLILAGVALNLTIGDNGIFKKTQETSEISKKANIKEAIELEIVNMELEKLKEGQTLTKEDIAKRLPEIGVEVTEQTDITIEGEVEGYPIIIDENNKVIIGDRLEGVKPTGTAEIQTKEEGLEEVEIRVTGAIKEGEIVAIEATNGAELKTDESATAKIFKVTKNGTFYFKIKASNGRSTIVGVKVSNALIANIDLLRTIEKIEESGIKKVKIEGSQNTEIYSLNVIRHQGDVVLDGSTEIEGASLTNNVYEFGTTDDVATQSQNAQNTVVLKVEGNLTINDGVTLTSVKSADGYGGPKGMIVYCTETLTNNGTISMTARGAKAEGQNVYLFRNQDNSYEFIPANGANGGEAISVVRSAQSEYWKRGNDGRNANTRQTGGGGTGAITSWGYNAKLKIAAGGMGTAYSGGSGSGAITSHTDNITHIQADVSNTGGNGGDGYATRHRTDWAIAAGGGAGNPGGKYGTYAGGTGQNGQNGTGGLLVLYGKEIENSGNIEAKGSNGGNGQGYLALGGGASGGGSINLFIISEPLTQMVE